MKRGFRGGYLDIYLPAMLPVVDVDQSGRTSRINSGSTITVDSLETELKHTKLTMGKALMKLVKKVKKIEDVLKRRHVVLPNSEDEDAEISSKQGRSLQEEGLDEMVRNMIKDKSKVFKTPTQGKTLREEVISPYNLLKQLNLWQMLLLRDWQKEEELMRTKEKEEELTEQQKQRKAQVQFKAQHYTEEDWDDIRAKLEASAELIKNVLVKELPEEDFAKKMVELVNQRKKFFAEERATARRNTKEKGGKVKKEEPVKRVGKRKKQKVRKGERSIYQIIRANGADTVYMSFEAMLKDFTREDLIELYRLVMQKYGTNRPEDAYDREAHNEDIQRNLKFTSEDQVRGGLLGIIVNRLKSGSYRVKSVDLDLFKLAIVLQKAKQIQDFGPTSGIRASRGTLMMMKHHTMKMHQTMVIQNGNSKKRISTGKDGVVRVLPPVSVAEIHAVEKERKARTILLMAIPKEHLRRFHGMNHAKQIWEAIRTRFGGNANSKKMQKAILKQHFEAFTISSSEGLEKGYDRFQQLLS
ncbi:hypothetical protein Tco_0298418 [Tanacetum coccineum]